MIEIDGSYGEGGGQILRTSIALSSLLKKPVRIFNIRANRPKPGLAPQHFAGIKAMCDLCDAKVEGLAVGSREVIFSPKEIKAGKYEIDIKTAGSISLILQTVLLPCLFAEGDVELKIKGGTDVKFAPPIDYVKNVLAAVLRKMGAKVDIEVLKRGYYPRGGGVVKVFIKPIKELKPIELLKRGKLIGIEGVAHSLNLPCHIVEREAISASRILEKNGFKADIKLECKRNFSQGTGITLWAKYENTVLGSSSLGEKGKRAEIVGEEAAKNLLEEIKSSATVDVHLADQLIPFVAIAGGKSVYTVRELTNHLKTNIFIVEKILEKKIFEIKSENNLYIVKACGIKWKKS